MSNEEPAEAETDGDAGVEEGADDADIEEVEAAGPDEGEEAADDEAAADSAEADEEAEVEAGAEAEEETGAEGDAETEAEGIQDGDFVRLAYTIRTVEEGTLVDTTDEAVAEEEGIDTEEQSFEPRVIVVGAGHVFPAVEEELTGKEPGDTGTVTVPAAQAFGEYDPDQVRTVSADRIPEDSRHPGGHVDIDGQHGHVATIIGGRARVDFNHMLAGEDLEYDFEVLEVVEDRLERARGLFSMFVDVDLDMRIETDEEERTVYAGDDAGDGEEADADEDDGEGDEPETETVELETLYVEATPQLSMNQQWLFQKNQIAQELIDRTGIDRVIVQEVLDGTGGLAGLGGLGGLGGGAADLEDVDAEEIVEELEEETDLDVEEADVDAEDVDADDVDAEE